MEPPLSQSPDSELVEHRPRSKGTVVGLILWRGGVYFSSGYVAYLGSKWILRLLFEVGVPTPLLVSASFAAGGVLLVLVSLIVERVQDARAEADLKELY